MATNPPSDIYTFEEYLAIEEESGVKHEYIDGEIFAMTGGTKRHAMIPVNSTRVISNQIIEQDKDNCDVASGDLRVKVAEKKYVYPDFLVVCGNDEFEGDNETTLTNPTLVCEVISESSKDYDTGIKSEWYRNLESLKHYLIIYQSRVYVQLFTRHTTQDAWIFREFNTLSDVVPLTYINVDLPLSEIYRGIEFESDEHISKQS